MGAKQDRTDRARRRQVGALCWRRGETGLEVLLITSRDTGRWVIPKGHRMDGVPDASAAAQEALEEAGVAGELVEIPLGAFHYMKRLSGKAARRTTVQVYPLKVTAELEDWKEARERTRRWFPPAEAAGCVDEPELKALLLDFRPQD